MSDNNNEYRTLIKRTNVAAVGMQMAFDDDFTLDEKAVYYIISCLPETWNLTIQGVMTLTGLGKNKVGDILNKFRQYGYLQTKKKGDGGVISAINMTRLVREDNKNKTNENKSEVKNKPSEPTVKETKNSEATVEKNKKEEIKPISKTEETDNNTKGEQKSEGVINEAQPKVEIKKELESEEVAKAEPQVQKTEPQKQINEPETKSEKTVPTVEEIVEKQETVDETEMIDEIDDTKKTESIVEKMLSNEAYNKEKEEIESRQKGESIVERLLRQNSSKSENPTSEENEVIPPTVETYSSNSSDEDEIDIEANDREKELVLPTVDIDEEPRTQKDMFDKPRGDNVIPKVKSVSDVGASAGQKVNSTFAKLFKK